MKQAKKLESFFLKTDVPPRPKLERTKKKRSKDWEFDINNDWLGRSSDPNFFKCNRGPYFTGFHLAWLSFFFCFMGWFAIGPLIPFLLKSGFSKSDIETSTTLSLASTIIIRFILGPFCEKYGPVWVLTLTLVGGGIVVSLTSTVTNGAGLMASRFFIGLIGGAFVPTQFWITMLFSSKIVGFMSGAAGGFGNAGAGVIVFVMAAISSGFYDSGYTDDQTWRLSIIIPGLMMILMAVPTYLFGKDCPQGKWKNRKYGTNLDRIGRMSWLRNIRKKSMINILKAEQRISRASNRCTHFVYRSHLVIMTDKRIDAFQDWRAWMVGIQYAIASGVELSILSGLTSFYTFEFGCDGNSTLQLEAKDEFLNSNTSLNSTCLALDQTTAAYIAAIFGLTNFYGRMLGGGLSDYLASSRGIFHGIRGRHLAIFLCLLLQGVTMLAWSSILTWEASAGFLILFSSFVHCSKGAVIAIAPFVSPGCVGSVMGVVSAVGNLGGVVMSVMYQYFVTSREVYVWQAYICMVGSLTAFTLKIHDLESNTNVWLLAIPSCISEEDYVVFEDVDASPTKSPQDDDILIENKPANNGQQLSESMQLV